MVLFRVCLLVVMNCELVQHIFELTNVSEPFATDTVCSVRQEQQRPCRLVVKS